MLLLKYINNTLKNSNIFKYSQAGPFFLRYGGPIPSQAASYKPGQANLKWHSQSQEYKPVWERRNRFLFCSAGLFNLGA